MATKTFTKHATYVQPAWTEGWEFMDGIYVDGDFFNKNIPILGASLTVKVKPTKHLRTRTFGITLFTYSNETVGQRVIVNHAWLPLTDGQLVQEIDLTDYFYGVGLNFIRGLAAVDLLTDAEIIYTVDYELKVKY